MNLPLFYPAEFELYYNCSFFDYQRVPLEERRSIALGVVYLILGVFFEVNFIGYTYITLLIMSKLVSLRPMHLRNHSPSTPQTTLLQAHLLLRCGGVGRAGNYNLLCRH